MSIIRIKSFNMVLESGLGLEHWEDVSIFVNNNMTGKVFRGTDLLTVNSSQPMNTYI